MKIALRFSFSALVFSFILLMNNCGLVDDIADRYFIRMKVNSVDKRFNDQTNLFGFVGLNGNQYSMLIASGNGLEMVGIQVLDDEDITTKTYAGLTLDQSGNFMQGIVLSFTDEASVDFSTDQNNAQGAVTITTINSTEIGGTFSGTLRNPLDGATLQITDGEFLVRRID